MLRLSKASRIAVAAAALLISTASLAQGGLGGRITEAGTKLDQDSQACKPINLGEYVELLREAAQNRLRADKAKAKGVPIDETQVQADLANASALFNRAVAAHVQQCMRAAQGQTQPPSVAAAPVEQANAYDDAGPPNGYPADWPSQSQFEGWVADIKAAYQKGDRYTATDRLQLLDYWHGVLTKYLDQATASDIGIRVDEFKGDVKKMDDLIKDRNIWYFLIQTVGESGRELPKILFPSPKAAEAEPPKREAATEPPKPTGMLNPGQPTQSSVNLNPFGRDALAAQNAIRSRLGVPPLQWRPDLEQGATAHARQMAADHELTHATRDGRGTVRENILKAPMTYTASQMMALWADEAGDFVPGTFPNVCRSGGECTGVYHLTQIAWATTFYVGCGEASDGQFNYAACWYDKGGNKDGKEVGTQAAAAEGYKLWNLEHAVPVISQAEIAAAAHDVSVPREMLTYNHDYGYDSGLFVGYDLGAFRIESEVAYKQPSNPRYASHMLLGGIAFNFGMDPVRPAPENVRDIYDDSFEKKYGIPVLPAGNLFEPARTPINPDDVM